MLADSINGYCSNFEIYTGRKGNQTEKGLGWRVVTELTKDVAGKHHHVYFDNYFTSVGLLEELLEYGTYGCGTARTDRKGFPKELKKVKLAKRYVYKVYVNKNHVKHYKFYTTINFTLFLVNVEVTL